MREKNNRIRIEQVCRFSNHGQLDKLRSFEPTRVALFCVLLQTVYVVVTTYESSSLVKHRNQFCHDRCLDDTLGHSAKLPRLAWSSTDHDAQGKNKQHPDHHVHFRERCTNGEREEREERKENE